MKLGGKISTSVGYVIDLNGLNPLSLWELKGVLIRKNQKNLGILRGGVGGETGNLGKRESRCILRMCDRILMKLDMQKNLMFQMLHFRFESDPGTLWVGRGEQKSWKVEILENAQSEEIGMKLDGKNNIKFQIRH